MFHPELKLLVMSKFPVQGDFACAVGASESRVSRAIRGRIKIRLDYSFPIKFTQPLDIIRTDKPI